MYRIAVIGLPRRRGEQEERDGHGEDQPEERIDPQEPFLEKGDHLSGRSDVLVVDHQHYVAGEDKEEFHASVPKQEEPPERITRPVLMSREVELRGVKENDQQARYASARLDVLQFPHARPPTSVR